MRRSVARRTPAKGRRVERVKTTTGDGQLVSVSHLEHEGAREGRGEEQLPPGAAKPNDRDGFPGKSDFLRAVNHSVVNRSLVGDVPLPPFVLLALPLRGARVLAQRFTIPTR